MDWIARIEKALAPVSIPPPEALTSGISSVLIAVGKRGESKSEEILLTKRTEWVESHKGQVSFPGGFWETHDASLVDTALRECREEIGIESSEIEVLGGLEPVQTHQGVFIYPWVGRVVFPAQFTVNPAEVEKVIFLPVDTLLKEGLQPVSVRVGEINVKSHGIQAESELVWGATARILELLRQRLL